MIKKNYLIIFLITIGLAWSQSCIDIDGNEYSTIQIGTQVWMSENLRVTHFKNGDAIPTYSDGEEWGNLTTPGFANFDEWIFLLYGNLYNWFAVDDARGLCPEGWHVPSDEEYKQLEISVGMSESEADMIGFRGTNEGSKLAGAYQLWDGSDEMMGEIGILESDNEFGVSGFNVLPAGRRTSYWGEFIEIGWEAYLWTSTEVQSCGANFCDAWVRNIDFSSTQIERSDIWDKAYGASVRCIQDEETELGIEDNYIPIEYDLIAAYPNPFNPQTTIQFSVPKYSNIEISIYNINGEFLETLLNRNYSPGNYEIIWNANNYSSGMYFVKMVSKDFIDTQKIMLTK